MSNEKPLRVVIETIPHDHQRYPTIGDWQNATTGPDPVLVIFVSKMPPLKLGPKDIPSWKLEALVAVHELIEALLCRSEGITAEQVDEFDFKFEEGLVGPADVEPGDHPAAPYKRQHSFATGIERQLAYALRVPWFEYEEAIESLYENRKEKETKVGPDKEAESETRGDSL